MASWSWSVACLAPAAAPAVSSCQPSLHFRSKAHAVLPPRLILLTLCALQVQLHDGAIASVALRRGLCFTGCGQGLLRVWGTDFGEALMEAQLDSPVSGGRGGPGRTGLGGWLLRRSWGCIFSLSPAWLMPQGSSSSRGCTVSTRHPSACVPADAGVAASADGLHVAAGTEAGTLGLLDLTSRTFNSLLHSHTGAPRAGC